MSPITPDTDTTSTQAHFTSLGISHPPNLPWGYDITTKSANSIRLYFQNIRGLSTKYIWSEWNSIQDHLHHHQVDIFGFAETNIPWTPTTKHLAHQQMKLQCPNNKATLSATSSDEPTLGWKQPGGVCMGALGSIVGGVETTTTDTTGLGRWSIIKIRGWQNTHITIITAYRVSQNHVTSGIDTAYNQQYRALRRQGKQNPKPRIQFIQDLITTVHKYKQEGEVIVMLDANSELTEKYMEQLLTNTSLYDVMGYTHNTHSPATYVRGTKTIDFLLATKQLLPHIKQAGMLSFNDGIQSDHRGLWLDFTYKTQTLLHPEKDFAFGNYIPTTKHVVHCNHMKKRFTEMAESSQIKEKIATLKLQLRSQPHNKSVEDLNFIDTLVDKAMLQPLKQIAPPTSAWWSPVLQDGIYLLQYWKLCGTEQALGVSFERQKYTLKEKLSPTVDIYQQHPDVTIQKQIRLARANLSSLRKNSFELRQQHLEQRAEHYAIQKDKKKETVLKQMKLAEYMSQMYKKIKRYLKPTTKYTLNKIHTVNDDGTIETHTNQ